ncbi:hypothetical protein Tco_1125298 [Tanacetum coccineum]|uniref:Uncharacterized protein n=1 Tax=Tanacetum coccineum TaxID=301880 RepID=A0ABQ5JBK8_9ASTR
MGRSPNISFLRLLDVPRTILNTLDSFGKFDRPVRCERLFCGYSTNSKGFKESITDDQHSLFMVHNNHAARAISLQRGTTADNRSSLVPLLMTTLRNAIALHDELVNLMHQESLAKLHNDAQRTAFEKEKKRIALEKGKECVDSTFTLSTANTPPQSTGNTPTDSDDDIPKDGFSLSNSFDDSENTDTEEE